jgi:predicted RNA-binding protein YlxR (DUF448 family)
MCLGCQELVEKKNLTRVVRTPEGDIIIDESGKKAGRGAYLCNNPDCLDKIIKNKQLDRALKIKIPTEIYEKLRENKNEE